MSQPLIAKPLLAVLLLTGVVSIVLTQRTDTSAADATTDLLPDQSRIPVATSATGPVLPVAPQMPWLRKTVPVLTLAHDEKPAVLALPPPPSVPPPVMLPPPPPPAPTAPQPGFSYLGRMVDDGTTTVFISSGDTIKAVVVGTNIDNDWQLESASSKTLKLRYLPLNETKVLPLSLR